MKERILLVEIYKQNGIIGLDFPNQKDVFSYELYGFLKLYLEILKEQLLMQIEGEE